MAFLSEVHPETALLTPYVGLGPTCASDEIISLDGKPPERDACDSHATNAWPT